MFFQPKSPGGGRDQEIPLENTSGSRLKVAEVPAIALVRVTSAISRHQPG